MPKIQFKDLSGLAKKFGMRPEPIENFFFHCRVKNLTPKTLECYSERLQILMVWSDSIKKDMVKLEKHDIQEYITSIIDRVSVATVNGRLAVYKVFYRYLLSENLIESEPTGDIKKLKEPKIIKPVLDWEEIQQILKQLNRKMFYGSRDHAMIFLTFDSMIRLNELLTIRVSQLDLTSGLIKIDGKGRKQRNVGFSSNTAKILHSYLIRFRKNIPGDILFCQKNGKSIDFRRAHRIFSIPAKKVGIKLYPHLARHSGATQFARNGGSLAVLQNILGHSSLAVTEKYLHLGDKDILSAYERFSPASKIRI